MLDRAGERFDSRHRQEVGQRDRHPQFRCKEIAKAHGPKRVASGLQERLSDAEALVAQYLGPNSVQKGLDIVPWRDPFRIFCCFDFVRIGKRLWSTLCVCVRGKDSRKTKRAGIWSAIASPPGIGRFRFAQWCDGQLLQYRRPIPCGCPSGLARRPRLV